MCVSEWDDPSVPWLVHCNRPVLSIHSNIYKGSIKYWIWNPEIKRRSSILKTYSHTSRWWRYHKAFMATGTSWGWRLWVNTWGTTWPRTGSGRSVWSWYVEWDMKDVNWAARSKASCRVSVGEWSGRRNDVHKGTGVRGGRGVPVITAGVVGEGENLSSCPEIARGPLRKTRHLS